MWWLTGAATLEDVQAVRDSVEGMTDQLQAQGAVLRGTEACEQADQEILLGDDVRTVRKLEEGHLLLYSVGEKLQERCAGSPIITHVLPPGTCLINVATQCIVDSDQGWRYQAIYVARKVVNVMNVFV